MEQHQVDIARVQLLKVCRDVVLGHGGVHGLHATIPVVAGYFRRDEHLGRGSALGKEPRLHTKKVPIQFQCKFGTRRIRSQVAKILVRRRGVRSPARAPPGMNTSSRLSLLAAIAVGIRLCVPSAARCDALLH